MQKKELDAELSYCDHNISCAKVTNIINCIFHRENNIFLYLPQADYCWKACHFTPYVRNPKCLNGSWDGEHVTKTTVKTPTEIQTTVKGERHWYTVLNYELTRSMLYN